jgi:two-component system OmpR family sensor kinase
VKAASERLQPKHGTIELRFEPTDLRRLLVSTMEILLEQASSLDITLRVEPTDRVPSAIPVDPEKIAWAVATLVGNAFRHVKRGTWRMPGGSIDVKLDYETTKNEVVIQVTDDGPGIPEDKVRWLFQRQPGATHAVGLGLMLVHDVVLAHNGSVDVKSATGAFEHGTTITLALPAGPPSSGRSSNEGLPA